MRRRLVAFVVGILIVAVAPTAAAADSPGEGGTYLALGDSVAAGTQQPSPFTDNAYMRTVSTNS